MVVSNIFYFHPYLGKISNLIDIFQRGWFNHQLEKGHVAVVTLPPLLPRPVPAVFFPLRSLIFAPLEIFMIRGLVASILGFWPGAPEAPRFKKNRSWGKCGWFGRLDITYLDCIYKNIQYDCIYHVSVLVGGCQKPVRVCKSIHFMKGSLLTLHYPLLQYLLISSTGKTRSLSVPFNHPPVRKL